jgi:hypothetical protein
VLDGYGFFQKLPKINNNNNKSFLKNIWRFSITKSEGKKKWPNNKRMIKDFSNLMFSL